MDKRMLVTTVCGDVFACEVAEASARERVRRTKREVEGYQALLLAHFAMSIVGDHPMILEVGTALGYSAATMAYAAPGAHVFTLNPKEHEVVEARRTLSGLKNLTVVQQTSVDYTAGIDLRDHFDLVFVDGDHAKVHRDFGLLWTLKSWGLLLFHDYSPAGCRRPCPPVFNGVNRMGAVLGREPDVLLVDEDGVGMAGFYRRPEDDVSTSLVNVLMANIELETKRNKIQ
jgi:predicted O-methyltransferase YrrM